MLDCEGKGGLRGDSSDKASLSSWRENWVSQDLKIERQDQDFVSKSVGGFEIDWIGAQDKHSRAVLIFRYLDLIEKFSVGSLGGGQSSTSADLNAQTALTVRYLFSLFSD